MSRIDVHSRYGHRIEVVRNGRRYEYRVYRLEPIMPASRGQLMLGRGALIGTGFSVTRWNARYRGRDMARRAHKRGAKWPKQ